MPYNEESYNQEEEVHDQTQPLSRSQKIIATTLALFAILTIVLWSVQFKKTIMGPTTDGTGTSDTQNLTDDNSDEALKSKDTDKDGLSDWDELNIYKTSPYLFDSDSDGTSDKVEIERGTDPNCPAGQTCFSNSSVQTSSTSTNDLGAQQVTQTGTNGNSSIQSIDNSLDMSSTEAQLFLSGQADAATLRQIFLKMGTSKAELDKVSDADLIAKYKELLKQKSTENPVTNNTGSTSVLPNISSVNNNDLQSVLSGQTDAKSLRQMLLNAGMQKEMLDKFSDEDLMATYKSILEKNK